MAMTPDMRDRRVVGHRWRARALCRPAPAGEDADGAAGICGLHLFGLQIDETSWKINLAA
jgi:hypothetical protein